MAQLGDRFYHASPVPVQQLMVALYGCWWYRRRFGAPFRRFFTEFQVRESWTAEQFRIYQEAKLHELFTVAARSPYYRQVFEHAGVKADISPFHALKRLPVLTKETLRERAKELLTAKSLPKGTLISKSSGTTGTPTEIYYTREFHALEMAASYARSVSWAGLNRHDRRVMFGVRKVCSFDQDKPPFWRFSPVENMAYASIYHLSPRFLPAYLEFLRWYQPKCIMGYPSALHTIARYALEANDLPSPAKAVVTTSETVTAQAREAIEAAWGCKVWDRYGAVEMCVFASQCEYGRYHVTPEVGIVELVDHEGKPVPPGSIGEVICTGLQNTLQPLIRYRIGDAARWAVDQGCSCKRQMPILESIEGRYEDICYTPDGRQMLRFDTVFKGVENIREAQIVQEKLNLFAIHIVPANGFDGQDAERIRQNMQLHVGNVDVVVRPVAFIDRSGSGKFRAVVCKLSRTDKASIGTLGL